MSDKLRAAAEAALEALEAMKAEFRALDLPYGSKAYTQGNEASHELRAALAAHAQSAVRLDSSREAAVDPDYYWRPILTAPLGAKVQLLTAGGVAIHGKLVRHDLTAGFYVGWTPLPKVPEDMK